MLIEEQNPCSNQSILPQLLKEKGIPVAGKPGEPRLDSPKDIFIFHRRLINEIIGREELNELTENYNRLDIVLGYCLVSNSEPELHISTRITG